MKILNLIIYDLKGEIKQNIPFKPTGISVIYGEIEKPKNDKDTSNSIGKTLLLKFIDIIYGGKHTGKQTIKGTKGYKLEANILFNGNEYSVSVISGDSGSYKINEEAITAKKYKEFFDINRANISKQLHLKKRSGIICDNKYNPSKEDMIPLLKMLNLDEIISVLNDTRLLQDKLSSFNEYSKYFGKDLAKLKEQEFVYEKQKYEVEQELKELSNRINSLNISQDSLEIIELHAIKTTDLKMIKLEIENGNSKIKRLESLILESDNIDISYKDIEQLYKRANFELPDMVKKSLEDIEKFYVDMFKDKKSVHEEEILKIKEQILLNDKRAAELGKEVEELANKIALNNVFKEAMSLYETKSIELSKISNEYGKITGAINEMNNQKEIKLQIDEYYIKIDEKVKKVRNIINCYQDYVYNLVKKIYGDKRIPYFNIEVYEGSRRYEALPIKVELNIQGDDGEGIKSVRNLVIDLMLFDFNKEIEFLIEDSSCFEAIDRRQVMNILKISNEIAIEKNKQYIVSLNKYQISLESESADLVINNRVIVLSETQKLLGLDF